MPRQPRIDIGGEVYHIINRSNARVKIFDTDKDYQLFEKLLQDAQEITDMRIFAYCIMPTHIHIVLRQEQDNGISSFMSNILNSYTRYFNIKHNRKGPLWEGRFKSVLIENDEYLLHLTRYIHLNPSTSNIVKDPTEWNHSSYHEYLKDTSIQNPMCSFGDYIDIKPNEYKNFVEDRIAYQKELKLIKSLLLD